MKWLRRGGLGLGALVLVLAVLPFFISLNDYIPRIETEASARLKQPVKIGSLRLAVLPLPHLTASGIRIGEGEDLLVGRVTATPDLWSLFSSTKVIRSIEIDKLVMTQRAIEMIAAATKPEPGAVGNDRSAGPPGVRVESVRLEDSVINFPAAAIGPFDARVRLDEGGAVVDASVVTRDGKLKALVKPDRNRYLVDASARGWSPPVGPALLFDELNLKGVATTKDASFGEIQARLYGGTLSGKASFEWESGIRLKGSFDVNRVDVAPLLKALGRPPTLSGRLTARPVFSASAKKPEQLVNALRLATPFEVQGGVLHGVDIGRAAASLISREKARGGETRFDRFSGHLAMSQGTRRLTQLNVASGSLAADGNVTVSARDELSGRVNATVTAGSVGSARVPLNVAGTLDAPLLYPTGGTVTGAAVGSAILGPLGTGIGAKVGQWAEDLFGGKDEPKAK